jgi:hypothetical protein
LIARYDAGVKLSRQTWGAAAVVCLLVSLPAQTIPASAQDTVTRLAASLTAITSGQDGTARRDAILAALHANGVEPAIETFGEGRGAGANIVVTLPGSDPRTIVIGAHYDRVNVGQGAVDNGAGCAALIELVAAFKALPLERSTLQVVFFDREEAGLLGSRAFFSGGRRVDYALNVDIFAYGDSIFATASNPSGVLLKSLKTAGENVGLPVRDVPRSRFPASDHVTMMNAKIETLGIAMLDAADIDGILSTGAGRLTPGKGPRLLTIIHTPNDTLAEVRPAQMMRGLAVIEQLIRIVDRSH